MKKILFIHNSPTEFVRLDLEALRKEYEVTEHFEESRLINPAGLWKQIKNHDLVFGWFASWHTLLPMQFAKLLGRPSVLVVGGYDVANMPEIAYGHQRGGVKKWVSRRAMLLATRVITNSRFSQEEIRQNIGLKNGSVRAIYHGIRDPFGELPQGSREQMALTVGNVDRSNLSRKGHEAFVRAAALLPEVSFVLVGHWKDDAIDYLRGFATPNVTFTGRVTADVLRDYYRRASVYVQPSRHEGFGMSVAEAMLAGCVPVTTPVGALPEVTGELGVRLESADAETIADAVETALKYTDRARAMIRNRVLENFPFANRCSQLEQTISPLMNGHRAN